jgi:hypothetical protein
MHPLALHETLRRFAPQDDKKSRATSDLTLQRYNISFGFASDLGVQFQRNIIFTSFSQNF